MEEWKDVDGMPYQVSSLGRVRSTVSGTILRQRESPAGYMCVRVYVGTNKRQKEITVHRMVASAFCDGKSESVCVVNHKDHNKKNNASSNLEWVTHSGNNIGAATCVKRVTKDVSDRISSMLDMGMSRKKIADSLGLSYDQVVWHTGAGRRRMDKLSQGRKEAKSGV